PLGAVIMTNEMAGLRLASFGGGGGWKRQTRAILLCGALTLTFASARENVGGPKTLSEANARGEGQIRYAAHRREANQ
ncbi:phage holin, lambda family, partial [Escherichia coli]